MQRRFQLPKVVESFSTVLILSILGTSLLITQASSKGLASSVITVNSTADTIKNDNTCTLREAVIAANKDAPSGKKPKECPAGSGADIIHLPADLGPFTLTRTDNGNEDSSSTGDLDINGDLTIEADGSGVVIDSDYDFSNRIFHILGGNVTLRGLTIRGGYARGVGGGIFNTATLHLINVTLDGNASEEDGGGLANTGDLTLNNVTITGNVSDVDGDNTGDGGGLASLGGGIQLSNSIVAGNSDSSLSQESPDCFGPVFSLGHNLVQVSDGCTLTGEIGSVLIGVAPGLEPLQNDTGTVIAYTPSSNSPAFDAGSPTTPGTGPGSCEATDQLGAYRPHGSACDIGSIEAGKTNTAFLIRASSDGETTTVAGKFSSAPNLGYQVQLYTTADPGADCSLFSSACTPAGESFLVTTNDNGDALFNQNLNISIVHGLFVLATVSDPAGFPSDYSSPVRVGAGNDSWPHALHLDLADAPDGQASVDDYIDLSGQSRWFKFIVKPGSKIILILTNLPANYDLTLYKDINQAFHAVEDQNDLLRLDAEFAPDAFTPDAFTADVFSPDAFTPDAFTPDAFTPDAFTPDAFTPDAFTPDAFTPDAFTPDAFTPDAFTPDAFTPDAFTPDAFTPDAFTPDAFTPDAFSSAQTRSLIAISAFDGLVSEGIQINTWDSTGEYYIRVRGRNGVFDKNIPFHLLVHQISGSCSELNSSNFPTTSIAAENADFHTLILTYTGRIEGDASEVAQMQASLQSFADRTEVSGKIIDASQDERVATARELADANPECPNAQNLLAEAIKDVVDLYWEVNPNLEYIVIVGPDSAIPFFRHPDHSMLASEKNYAPPVLDGTSSQASLKLGYVLSQDNYGSRLELSLKDDEFPLPSLAVGRLAETADDITTMLDAYLETLAGVAPAPQSGLVSGYDFLEDSASQVFDQLSSGLGSAGSIDSLIAPRDKAPTDPAAWTADDLRSVLFGSRHDLIFLAGHFSASSALAADYETRIFADELAASTVDFKNSVLFSAGCHAGYNIINPHGIPGLTREPDWVQAAAQKGITLIAGTGYQYGDTDLLKYSEQIYLEFSKQLRRDSGPIAVGKALVRAKQSYLAENPYLRGIDEKAILEATLFGFPMLSVDMPGERWISQSSQSIVQGSTPSSHNPGAALGLEYADISVFPQTALNTVDLTNLADPSTPTTAVYLSGRNGEVSKPNEPTMPLELYSADVPSTTLRGVGFRSGTYTDLPDSIPLTGATATEIRGVHTPFISNIFFPTKPWAINNFNALSDGSSGDPLLALIPAQFQSESPASMAGILRQYNQMDFRLYYSQNISTYVDSNGVESTPALAAAPSIVKVTSDLDNGEVHFLVRVVGNPSAGIEEVWVTTSVLNGSLNGTWSSIDLSQNDFDSTIWEGALPLNGVAPEDIRYMVQAVNGIGLVSLDTNIGRYYIPGNDTEPGQPTDLEFAATPPAASIPSSGAFSTAVTFSARLTSAGVPLVGQPVAFGLGAQGRLAITDAEGIAKVALSIYGLAGQTEVRASYAGAGDFQASFATAPFTIVRQTTQIQLDPPNPAGYPLDSAIITATLMDAGSRRLGEETLFFVIDGPAGSYKEALITDYAGRARLGKLPLPPGEYALNIYFSGSIPQLGIDLFDDRYEPATLNTTLTLLNHLPQSVGDSYSVYEDELLQIPAPGILANDSDVDGDDLQAILLDGPGHGSLILNADGSFTYLPEPDFYGSDTFSYAAGDGADISSPADVLIEVLPVNDPPIAVLDSYVTNENQTLSIPTPGVLTNDTDTENDPLQAVLVAGPENGMINLNSDGSFTYQPQPGFDGMDSFTYTASDGLAVSQPAMVLIGVNQVNSPPDCSGASPSIESLWPPTGNFTNVTILGLADPDGDALSWDIYAVFQDEPVDGAPDAILYGSSVALRAQRDGSGDGRVYHIYFNVDDGQGGVCSGVILLGVVPHDQGNNLDPIDGGPLFDSTLPD